MTRTTQQKTRLQQMIDWLAQGAPRVKITEDIDLIGFDYEDFIKYNHLQTTGTCRITACIAGAAYAFHRADQLYLRSGGAKYRLIVGLHNVPIENAAADLLGLNEDQRKLLFWPFNITNSRLKTLSPQDYNKFKRGDQHPLYWTQNCPPQQIAIVLQCFQDTDQINWSLVK